MRFSKDQVGWDADDFNAFDEVDILEGFDPDHIQPMANPSLSIKIRHYAARMLLPLCMIGTGVVLWWLSGFWQTTGFQPQIVYVEVKALSESGHPIAGAEVEFGTATGITDAFGEWRRYLKVGHDDKIAVRVSKESAAGMLLGTKTINLPLPSQQGKEPEIKVRIRLLQAGKLNRAKAFLDKVKTSESKDTATVKSEPMRFHKIEMRMVPMPAGLPSDAQKLYKISTEEVWPELRKAFQSQGFEFGESPDLKLQLRYVPQHSSGYLRMDVAWLSQGKWHQSSYLGSIKSDARATANEFMTVFRAFIPQEYQSVREGDRFFAENRTDYPKLWRLTQDDVLTDGVQTFPASWDAKAGRIELLSGQDQPCLGASDRCTLRLSTLRDRPPQTGWRKLRFKIVSGVPKGSAVFVAGFEAQSLGQGLYEFWGKPGDSMNLTVLQGSRLRARQKIQARASGVELVMIEQDALALR